MIVIYTTIAQHPKGLDLHVRNLHWAFSNLEHRIIVQTFSEYGFRNTDGVEILSYESDSTKYFHFHDYLDINMGEIIVLVQQDNVFARKVDSLIHTCRKGVIITWDQDSYFAIYDRRFNKIYPRIGEISTFMQRDTVEEFKSLGLSFGCGGCQFAPSGDLFNKYRHILENHFINTRPWLPFPNCYENLVECCKRDKKEIFFEAYIYSFCTGRTVELLHPYMMLHMQNPERFHREEPKTYKSPEHLLSIKDDGGPKNRRYIPTVALMFLLSGVYGREFAVSEALRMGGRRFRSELQQLSHKADEWMSDEQLDRLHWANGQVGNA